MKSSKKVSDKKEYWIRQTCLFEEEIMHVMFSQSIRQLAVI